MTTGCEARRTGGDQVMCARCGLNWDHDDPEPPTCPKGAGGPAKPPIYNPDVFIDGAIYEEVGTISPDALDYLQILRERKCAPYFWCL